ncbi:MAG: glycosyltransferase family 2 protein [Acidobacteriota bacterium]|nr:glycosyltransferase family 2 protein [Acidobacteriota bacterium]
MTAVIPNWNGSALLAKVLEDLRNQTLAIEEVIVVDNGSTDDSVAVAERGGARVIEMRRNAGFGPAVNAGIRAGSGEWILILNNDVELGAAWLATLLERAESRGASFACGKLLDARHPERIDAAYDAVSRGACAWRCGSGRLDGPEWNRERAIRMAPLTAALFRAEVFERVGLLDEEFESYLEDVDFGIRCSVAGMSGIYVPDAAGFHYGSATLGYWHPETARRIARNQLLLVARHYPPGWMWRYGWAVMMGQALWGLLALKHGRGWAFLRGKWEGLVLLARSRRPQSVELADKLHQILVESENEILRLQKSTGYDAYWRSYFALT